MAGIQASTGLATGIDITGTVDKLLAIESQPSNLLKSRLGAAKTQQTAIADLTASVIGVQLSVKALGSSSLFAQRTVSSSSTGILSAAVSSSGSATAGNYQITSVRQAAAQQLLSQGVASKTAALGAGTFTIQDGSSNLAQGIDLSDLNGGEGVERGKIRITDRSGTTAIVDLRYAQSIDDVLTAINTNETINVTARAKGDAIELVDNTGQTTSNLRVQEVGSTKTAADLGLVGINAAASSATGSDVVKLYGSLALDKLNDGNGLSFNKALADLRVTFQDGSSPLDIDFNRVAQAAKQSVGTTDASGGVNGDIKFTAVQSGGGYDGVQIVFTDSGNVTQGNETVAYDSNAKTLTFDIDAGATTANDVIAALSGNPTASALFTAQTASGGDGSATIDLADTATTSGGAAVAAKTELTLTDLVATINEADPTRLRAAIGPDGDRIVLTDLTTDAGGTLSVSSLHGGTLAEDLGLAKSSAGNTLAGGKLLAGLKTTLLKSLNGGRGFGELGNITITDRSGGSATVNLASAETVDDILSAINGAGIGVRAELNSSGNGIQVVDTTGSNSSNLIIANADASNSATKLGLVSNDAASIKNSGTFNRQIVNENTLLSDFNHGKGVANGSFTLTDSSGAASAINLTTLGAKSIGDVLKAINDLTIGVEAKINDAGDGIVLVDTAGGAAKLTVTDVGSSTSANDLKIAGQSSAGTSGGVAAEVIDGSTAIQVTLDSDDSLSDLVDKINALDFGLDASIFTEGSSSNPFRLALTSAKSGKNGNWVVDGKSSGLSFTEIVKGQNSLAAVGGSNLGTSVLVSSSTNVINNAINGIDVTVKGTSADPVTITVAIDTANIAAKVKSFVDTYNKLVDKLESLDFYNSDSATKGSLFGSAETLRVRSDFTRAITGRVTGAGSIKSLEAIGVSFGSEGKLQLDSSRLDSAYQADSAAFEKFFTQEATGFAAKIDKVSEQLAGRENSVLINRTTSIQRQVDTFNERIDAWTKRLATTKERLLTTFYNLETTVSSLKNAYSAVEGSLAASASLASYLSSSK